ncbi:MAG TPA: tRNA preQ1(34) S-adenosylmethionine ribosyltransferase-isomerase QueA [Clostridia bacterium]|nr:tRNA preQ1(34) S-adenosylmethionine ribosyltransferase-isomerase QueA [Clostridia bacterium]
MKTKDFYYNLPEELIAQTPIEPRDASRMLVYDRKTKNISHEHFFDIEKYLKKGDLLVINNTKVLPARIYGYRPNTNGKVEFLLLKRLDINHWETLTKPGRATKIGDKVVFSDELTAEITDIIDDGVRIARFSYDGVFEDIISRLGEMPLPPYIKEKLTDKQRYNTVYSKIDGSSAAPTAGLHFTVDLMKKLENKGVEFAEVLLHVGLGTFRPVKEDEITDHKMHSEFYEINDINAEKINKAKREGRRIIAVGTTSVRVLESVADDNGIVKPCKGDTEIFIYPPYKFKCVDALVTNFHLPESTLLMLVSAFCGREETLRVYDEAVKEKYRFFSFGDATFFI